MIVHVSYDVEISDADVLAVMGFMGRSGDDREVLQNYLERFGMSHLEKLREGRTQ